VCNIQNGTAGCAGSLCTVASCSPGWGDCNNSPADGCETNTDTTTANCGTCGHACMLANATATCIGGACQILNCANGYADCNNNPSDGCETWIATDSSNCGACNHVCTFPNGIAGCNGGTCTLNGCQYPYGNCDGNPGNGCEVDLWTDVGNCATCGHACPGAGLSNDNVSCLNGACTFSCVGENYDVDNNALNGCEVLHPGTSHTTASAFPLGSWPCNDGSLANFGLQLESDQRAHVPTPAAFNGTVGDSPDVWSVLATGSGGCYNDYGITFTTSGGSAAAPCYQLVFQTNKKTVTLTTTGSGMATTSDNCSVFSPSCDYDNNTTIYFTVQKTCSVAAVQESVNYTVSFHL
jgi:hypothetical protein